MAKSDPDLQKHTLNLFKGDYERLQLLYPDTGAGAVIRRVVRSFLEQVDSGGDETDLNVEVKI